MRAENVSDVHMNPDVWASLVGHLYFSQILPERDKLRIKTQFFTQRPNVVHERLSQQRSLVLLLCEDSPDHYNPVLTLQQH